MKTTIDSSDHKRNQKEFDLREVSKTVYQYEYSIPIIVVTALSMAVLFLSLKHMFTALI